MAITKLMHMKEDKIYPSKHLRDSINYILDVEHDGAKTEYGLWVGGNVGTEADVVYHKFMETKKAWGKEKGRQGYHFVISFAPNETDEATCYEVLKKFCEEYLGNEFEYVFAVHNDKDHMHGHIIFNSVNRMTGRKYRYENGDWEKYIQPITDKITKEYGLAPLEFTEERKGKAYADWTNGKNGDLRWKDIIRADVDLAIKNSSNMEEFFLFMKEIGYSIRSGTTTRGKEKKEETYLTFYYTDASGNVHRKRNYSLLPGTDEYSIKNIKAKIENKLKLENPHFETVALILERRTKLYLGNYSYMKNYRTFHRLHQAVGYYKLPNPFVVPSYQVREDIIRIDKLIEECAYIKRNPSSSFHELKNREENLDKSLKSLYIRRKSLKRMEEEFQLVVPKEERDRYMYLKKRLQSVGNEDETWEILDEEIKDMEEKLPTAYIFNAEDLLACEIKIKTLENEKRILGRVIKMEGEKIGNNYITQAHTRIPKK